jgi:hypothetical protein
MVREPDATMQLASRGQDGQNEIEQPNHSASLGDSISSSTRMKFSHQPPRPHRGQPVEVPHLARGQRCKELLGRGLFSFLHLVQVFWLEVRVPPQHAPILMARHHCNLLDGKASLEKPTGPFMAQIVKAQIVEIDYLTRPMKCSSDRF